MRNFSWTYFTKTGDVDAFMLFKEVDALDLSETESGTTADGTALQEAAVEQVDVLE